MACRKCGEKKPEYAFGHCKECATQATPDALYCHDCNKNIPLKDAIEHAEKGHILSEVK